MSDWKERAYEWQLDWRRQVQVIRIQVMVIVMRTGVSRGGFRDMESRAGDG